MPFALRVVTEGEDRFSQQESKGHSEKYPPLVLSPDQYSYWDDKYRVVREFRNYARRGHARQRTSN